MDALKRAKRKFWIALAVTIAGAVLIGATWVVLTDTSFFSTRTKVTVYWGSMIIYRDPAWQPASGLPQQVTRFHSIERHWTWHAVYPALKQASTFGSPLYWVLEFPLWPLLLPPAFIAFRAHRTIRRLSRDVCKNCAYSRAGLAADAPCPECGTSPIG